jgi:hypothetical protein
VELDITGWSGEGTFTQVLIDALRELPGVHFVKVEDAPASRADSSFSFISNEIFVAFETRRGAPTFSALSGFFESRSEVGAPDYEDDGMLQFLKTERIIPPYQTRGYKLIELVRVYKAGATPRRDG